MQDWRKLFGDEAEKMAEMARDFVKNEGGEVVYEFPLTKGTPVQVFRAKFKDNPDAEQSVVFLGGKFMCLAGTWEAATTIGAALGYAVCSSCRKDKGGGKGDKTEGREW